jgi:MFS family permease
MTATPAAAVFFAAEDLDLGGAGYGLLMSVWGAGMAVGALVVAPRVRLGAMGCAAVAAVAAQGLGIAVPALWPMVWLALAGYLFGGVAHGTKNVLLRTLIHERVPEAGRGRAFAAYNAARNGAELAALGAGGVIVGLAGAQLALAVAGAVPLAIGIVTLLVTTAPATRRRPAYA